MMLVASCSPALARSMLDAPPRSSIHSSAAAVSVVAMTGRVTVVVVVADFLLDSNAAASRARKLSVF